MSTISAQPTSRFSLPTSAAFLTTPAGVAAVGVFTLLGGIGGGMLVATSDHLVQPVAYGVEIVVIVVTTAGAALVWAVSRPGNRIAWVLLAYAAAVAGVSLQGAASPLLYSLGVLFDLPAFLLGYYLVFIVPEGRLSGVLEKALLIGAAGIMLTSFVPWFFFSPVVAGGAPLATCNASCPENTLMIADRPGIASGLGETELYFAALWAAAVVAVLLYRLASASRPRRRALLPVYVPALLLTIPFGLFAAARIGLLELSPESVDTVGWFATAGRTLFSVGFLLAIVQAVIFAGVVLRTILSRLDEREGAAHLRELVASALDDDSLELAFEIDRDSRFYVDSHGDRIDITALAPGSSATALRRRGETVAYIVHDSTLDSDPELLQAAGQSVLLALETGRLESELQSRTDELRASRARIVSVSDAERRKIERDLHDGAQQRLMAIQIKLAMAEHHATGEDLLGELEAIRVDAEAAVQELRTLAHGIYPTILRERGLADALRSVAMTAPIAIRVTDDGVGRCAPTIETTIYFCSLEAIQNAIKHAGPGAAQVTVTLARRDGSVCFEVADDGVGMEPRGSTDGLGLLSMHDRIGAVGGQLEIASSPGQGTTVRGVIPEAADDSPLPAAEHAP